MKKIISLFILTFLLVSCWTAGCQTKECLDYAIQKQKLEQEQLEKDRAFELEQMKIQAEIEANKPVEVRVQEAKNEETSVWDAITTTAVIWWTAYWIAKLIDIMQ